MNKFNFIIYTDGGARGNPGPAAAGIVIDGAIVGHKKYGEYLGEMTNNEAEYRALIIALKKLKHLIGGERAKNSHLEVYLDSELIEKQLNGKYKIKDEKIKEYFIEIWNLKIDFGEVIFKHIPREKNSEADMIVNQTLDKELQKLNL
jgi:ribonuclease HI